MASARSGTVFSVLTRWEQIAIIMLFFFLRRKGSIFMRNPRLAVAFVVAILTVSYSLLAMIPDLVSQGSCDMQAAETQLPN